LALAAVAVASGVFRGREETFASSTSARPLRVAVLPLRRLGGPETQYFADGVTASLRNALATVQGVEVIAGTSADAFADSLPAVIRAALGADFVLRGTVQWAGAMAPGTRVQVVPELLDVRGTAVVRPQVPVDVALVDLFQAQGEIARRIVDSLGVQLGALAATQMADAPTRNLEAYQAYLRDDLSRAVALDSTFGVAWAGIAEYAAQDFFFDQSAEQAARGRAALAKARRYAPDRWETPYAAGYFIRNVDRNYAVALEQMRLAKERAPGSAVVSNVHAALLWIVGRFPEALEEARRGAALDPRNQQSVARLGRLHIWLRDRASASRHLGEAIALDRTRFVEGLGDSIWLAATSGDTAAVRAVVRSRPGPVGAAAAAWTTRVLWIGWALTPEQRRLAIDQMRADGVPLDQRVLAEAQDRWLSGESAAARAMADSASVLVRAVMRASPREPAFWSRYVLTLALGGHQEAVAAHLDSARAVAGVRVNHFEGAYWQIALAESAALVGMRTEALALLRELLDTPGLLTPEWLRTDPYFASLRKDAEFRTLAGLPSGG
jgi:TolB-like protein